MSDLGLIIVCHPGGIFAVVEVILILVDKYFKWRGTPRKDGPMGRLYASSNGAEYIMSNMKCRGDPVDRPNVQSPQMIPDKIGILNRWGDQNIQHPTRNNQFPGTSI